MSFRKIRKIYEMLFPYGFYNDRPGESCVIINRELRSLCKKETRHVLLMLGRYLSHVFKPSTPTGEICEILQRDIQTICLSITNLEERAKYVIGAKTGFIDVETTIKKFKITDSDRLVCRYFLDNYGYNDIYSTLQIRNYYFPGLNAIYTYKNGPIHIEMAHKREIKKLTIELERNKRIIRRNWRTEVRKAKKHNLLIPPEPNYSVITDDFQFKTKLEEYINQIPPIYRDLIEKGKYNEIFKLDYEDYKDKFMVDNLMDEWYDEGSRESAPFLKKKEQAEFLVRLIQMFLNDEIPIAYNKGGSIEFTKWSDIC